MTKAQLELLQMLARGDRDGFTPRSPTLARLHGMGFVESYIDPKTFGQLLSWRITKAGRKALTISNGTRESEAT